MSTRAVVAVFAALAFAWTWETGNIGWVIAVVIIYVVWMLLRIPLQRRSRRDRMPGFTEYKP